MEKNLVGLMAFYYFYLVALGIATFMTRFNAVKNKRMRPGYFKLYEGEIPENVRLMGNHLNNQFQLPVVFLVVASLGIALHGVTQIFFILACAFVISRLAHSWFHLKGNIVLLRALSYFVGVFILAFMWILLFLGM